MADRRGDGDDDDGILRCRRKGVGGDWVLPARSGSVGMAALPVLRGPWGCDDSVVWF